MSAQRVALCKIDVDTLVSTLTLRGHQCSRPVTLTCGTQGYFSERTTQDQQGSNVSLAWQSGHLSMCHIIMVSSYIVHALCASYTFPLITGPVHLCKSSTPLKHAALQSFWRCDIIVCIGNICPIVYPLVQWSTWGGSALPKDNT